MFPIRLGTDAEFIALREALLACDYTEAAICSRFSVHHLSELRAEGFDFASASFDPASLLTRLFIACETVPASSLPVPKLAALGLITTDGDRVTANVMLYPARNLFIVSDHQKEPLDDIVYPANGPNTELFLNHLPSTSCDAFLDLCAGTGIAALAAAQNGASHAWAFDITARSTYFAEFNRRLNAIGNVTVYKGDLYEPADDQTFDRIVAHPPYLPVYRPHFVFDSGGQDGEQIVRRIIEGLPRYLRPGGRFYALTMGSDREQTFEYRLREWLGEAAHDFDIAYLVRKTVSPREYAADTVLLHKGSLEDITGWRELFEKWGVRALPYGFVVIQRRASDRPVFTVRREAGPKTGPAELARLIDQTTAALDLQALLKARPHAEPNVTLEINHRLSEGAWQEESYRLETDYPFRATMRAEPWTAHLLALADGTRTVEQLLDHLKSEGSIPPAAAPQEFARAVATLISTGFLNIPAQ